MKFLAVTLANPRGTARANLTCAPGGITVRCEEGEPGADL
jgi:hypothetical protein